MNLPSPRAHAVIQILVAQGSPTAKPTLFCGTVAGSGSGPVWLQKSQG